MPDPTTLYVTPRVLVNAHVGTETLYNTFTLPSSLPTPEYVLLKLVEVPSSLVGATFSMEEGVVQPGGGWSGDGLFYSEYTGAGDPLVRTYKLTAGATMYGRVPVGMGTGATGNLGKTVRVSYLGIGSEVAAEDLNGMADGSMTAVGYTFNGDVSVPGDLSVTGDLNISGVINETDVETLRVKDNKIVINAGGTLAVSSAGIYVDGATGPDGLNPGLVWTPEVSHGQTGGVWGVSGVVYAKDGLKPRVFAGACSSFVSEDGDIGRIFYSSVDNQFFGVAGPAGSTRVVLLG